MLLQFSVENFRSIERMDFSMRATADKSLRHHVVEDKVSAPVLRAAAIYGANGAGKSNIVHAMALAQNLILEGTQGESLLPVNRFRLNAQRQKEPSRFEFIFRHAGVLYSYGFAISERHIEEEWLFAGAGKSEARWFERTTDEKGVVTVVPGASLKREVGAARTRFLAQGTRANQLFLTECRERNVESMNPVMDWFSNVLTVIAAESEFRPLPVAIRLGGDIKDFLTHFLKAAGTGITSVDVTHQPVDLDQVFAAMSGTERAEIQEELRDLNTKDALIVDTVGARLFLSKTEDGKPCLLRILTYHRDAQDKEIPFRLEDESDGTQRLFHLVPGLFQLKTASRVLVIDELDRRLHTELTRLFVQQALDCREDDPHGQLIYTTHDTNLLDLDLLRRDEIWFVEKDKKGASHFASLAEWKVRPDMEIERNYLAGRFGAIPYFGDMSRLCFDPQAKKVTKTINAKTRAEPVAA